MSTIFQTDYHTDTLTFGTNLNTVGIGAYSVPSGLIDNTYVGGNNRLSATLLLTFSTPLTAGTGSPFITLYPLLLPDGATYPNPPGNAAASPSPNARQFARQVNASAAYSALEWESFDLEPGKYAFLFYNNSGVAWSGTVTATLYRFGLQTV